MSLVIFIAILVVLIWVHELGHFVVAKLSGVRVDEFNIGFPPRLLSWRWGETKFSLNLILLGGYVNIHGENPDEGSKDRRALTSKNRWVQAAVLLAGIVFNLLFAWFALSAGYVVGVPTPVEHAGIGRVENAAVTIIAVIPGSPAEKAGLQSGDRIENITTSRSAVEPDIGSDGASVQKFIQEHQDESMIFSINRDGETKNILAKPAEGIVAGKKVAGIQMEDMGVLKLPPHLALVQGAVAAGEFTMATAQGLGTFFWQIIKGAADFSQVSGPIGIAGLGSQAVRAGFNQAATLTALISINLALINVLPIPGLDGGRLLIVAIEGILRRSISLRVTNALTLAGFALLIALMLTVTFHDISKLVG